MKEVIAKLLKRALDKKQVKLKPEEIESLIEIPPSSEMGDYAFPCFSLSEKFKTDPHEIALELREEIGNPPSEFEDIQTEGAYINFFIDRKNLARDLIKEILGKGDRFGKQKSTNQKIMVEFSQPNTHKAFHVGHIRGTSLGESISRILEFCGYKVIRANYMGDTGMHVAKWIWCYQKYHSKEELKKDEAWISSIYVDAVKRLERTKTLKKEVEEINRKLSTREDKKLNSLWKKTKEISLKSLVEIYKQLNTYFDVYYFESEMEKRGIEIVDELLKKKIARISDDAVIVNLKKYKLGVWVLLRKDKTVLYSTKDLALAEAKFKKYKLNQSIYLHGAEQNLHFKQLFKTLDLTGFPTEKLYDVSMNLVRLPHGKMSSRTGENVLYSEFLEELMEHAKQGIKKREPRIKKQELEDRALKISIAAMKYSMLKQNANRTITFNPKESINFEGDTGPYILYSYARALSILRKVRIKENKKINIPRLDGAEIELIKKLSQFQDIVFNAYNNLSPSIIANYSYQLSQVFNEFYHACPVKDSEKEFFRISLLKSFIQVLKNSLWLLGIDTIDKM